MKDSEFELVGEKRTKEDMRLVRTIVKYDGQKVRIDYRLRRKKNIWRVWDVVIENIGLVATHRDEFRAIVRKEKFAGLLTRLKKKTNK